MLNGLVKKSVVDRIQQAKSNIESYKNEADDRRTQWRLWQSC